MKKAPKVIIARLGMDAHWRGSIVVARALQDAGMEVVYLGNQMPDGIVQAALQEDADIIGLSSLSGNHMVLAQEVLQALADNAMRETIVVLGGTVPPNDIPELKRIGVAEVFGPGARLDRIVSFLSNAVETQRNPLPKHACDKTNAGI